VVKKENYTMLEWELLERIVGKNFHHIIRRAQVPGGWLIESSKYVISKKTEMFRGTMSGVGYGVGLTFIPDPEYKWHGLEIVKFIDADDYSS